MVPMKVIAIAAVAQNGAIGKRNGLPWEIPEDMKFFRDSTRDQIVLMGRKTLDSLGKPLPKRENAVITRDLAWNKEGVRVFHDLEAAISFYKNSSEFQGKTLFVIGGAEIYRLALPFLDEVWLTEIEQSVEGDAFFPDYQQGEFIRPEFQIREKKSQTDFASGTFRYSFNYYSRVI